MRITLQDTEGLKGILRERLLNGWVVLSGELKCLEIIEDEVYPPGTPKNRGYEVVMSPLLPSFGFSLGKKTRKLRGFLQDPPDFDKTVLFEFLIFRNEKTLVNQKYLKAGKTLEEVIDEIIQYVIPQGGTNGEISKS